MPVKSLIIKTVKSIEISSDIDSSPKTYQVRYASADGSNPDSEDDSLEDYEDNSDDFNEK